MKASSLPISKIHQTLLNSWLRLQAEPKEVNLRPLMARCIQRPHDRVQTTMRKTPHHHLLILRLRSIRYSFRHTKKARCLWRCCTHSLIGEMLHVAKKRNRALTNNSYRFKYHHFYSVVPPFMLESENVAVNSVNEPYLLAAICTIASKDEPSWWDTHEVRQL